MAYILSICAYLYIIRYNLKRFKTINVALVFNVMWCFCSISIYILKLPRDMFAFVYVALINVVFFVFYALLYVKSEIAIKNKIKEIGCLIQCNDKYDKITTWVIFFNVLGLVYLFKSLNFSLHDFRSIDNLANHMREISISRYVEHKNSLSVVNRLINSFVYAACAYDGFYFIRKVKKKYLVNLLLLVFQTVVLNTKATIIFGLTFWIAGLLTGIIYFKIKIDKKIIVSGIILILSCFLFGTLINYLRHARFYTFGRELKEIFISYLVGPFSAYNIWFHNVTNYKLTYGANSFASLYSLLGLSHKIIEESVKIGNTETNVYTLFKMFNKDFGKVFTVFIFIFGGAFSGIVESKLKLGKDLCVPFYMIIYLFVLVSFFTSAFYFNINILASLLILLYAIFCKIHVCQVGEEKI
jgi:oligosaccharide repeat unit polymerase